MKKIRLYGEWGRRFGREFELDVKTPAEAIRALCTQVQGFRQFLHAQSNSKVSVLAGKHSLTPDELGIPSSSDVIRVIPVVAGSGGGKGGNWAQIIVGIILVAVSWYNPYSWGYLGVALAGGVGASLISSGVSGLLTKPPPELTVAPGTDPRDSFYFGGSVNRTGQGNPVPICYGKMIVGSQVIAIGLETH